MAIRCKNGSYCVYWNDETGKRCEKYFGSGPIGKFKAEKFNERLGFGKQKRLDRQAVLFGQFIEEYLKHLKAITKNQKNYRNVEWSYIGTLLPFFGSHDIYALTHSDLDDFIIHRKGQITKKGTPPKQVSINREIDDIQSYLNWCVINKKILNNPLQGFKRPKDDREVIAPPSTDEINKMIAAAAPHVQRFIIISYYIGARPGPVEIGALKWSKVSWDEKKILIRSADKKGIIGRRVDIHEILFIYLQQWFLEDQNNDVPVDHIVHYKGKPVGSIKKGFKRAKERAGITRRLRPYDIRHAHVTHQLEQGADIKAVSLNVGHKSPETTRKVYQHVSGKLQKEAIEKLPALDKSHLSEMFNKKLG